jgi:mannitol-1-phosphate/altronate dehydrogenase
MSEAADDPALMKLARDAFLEESGAALIARHQGLDPLFTPAGYQAYADDLLERMTNPYLRDRIERVIRDTPRKLSWDDRLIGTMRLALDAGVTPWRFALGAAAAIETLLINPVGTRSPAPVTLPEKNGTRWNASIPGSVLNELWPSPDQPPGRKAQLIELIAKAQSKLKSKES